MRCYICIKVIENPHKKSRGYMCSAFVFVLVLVSGQFNSVRKYYFSLFFFLELKSTMSSYFVVLVFKIKDFGVCIIPTTAALSANWIMWHLSLSAVLNHLWRTPRQIGSEHILDKPMCKVGGLVFIILDILLLARCPSKWNAHFYRFSRKYSKENGN